MNTPPLSPSHSTRSVDSSDAAVNHGHQPHTPSLQHIPSLRLPPGLHPETPSALNQSLDLYQANVQLPAGQAGWMAPAPQMAGPISTPPRNLEQQLAQWVKESPNSVTGCDRIKAESAILKAEGGRDLTLQHLCLGSLPEIFDHPLLSALKKLTLNDCSLTRLPDSLGQLTNLTELNLNSNELSTLPASINHLKKLERLVVGNNRLSSLPEELSGLCSLNILDISRNPISDFPGSLRSLPLTELDASRTALQSLPDVVTSLHSLEYLELGNTLLTTLPSQISQLTSLDGLILTGARLTSLPDTITQLPDGCGIDLTGNPLSQNIIDNLITQLNPQEGGPLILFPEGQMSINASLPLERNVAKWLSLTPEQSDLWQTLGKNEDARHFDTWLGLMAQTQDFTNLQTRPRLQERMKDLLSHLTEALEASNRQQVEPFLGAAHEATSTCEDRIAVGLNNMEMLRVNHSVEQGGITQNQLLTLGREMFVLEQIKAIAAEKVKGLLMVDEVEVHLAYQTGLKQAMGLTLGNDDMLYRRDSQVTGTDITQAAERIQQQLQSEGVLTASLVQWTPMREHIRREHPSEWQAIEDEYNTLLEKADDAGDGDTLSQLGNRRIQAFDKLCEDKVKAMLSTDLPSSSKSSSRSSPREAEAASNQRFQQD